MIDKKYFKRRADAHLELARSTDDPAIARLHRQFATLYLQRVRGPKILKGPIKRGISTMPA